MDYIEILNNKFDHSILIVKINSDEDGYDKYTIDTDVDDVWSGIKTVLKAFYSHYDCDLCVSVTPSCEKVRVVFDCPMWEGVEELKLFDNREAVKEFREETKKKENADMTEPLMMYVEVYNEPLSLHDDAFQVWIKDQECNPLSHSIEQDTNIGMAAREAVRDHMKHLYNQREHDIVTKLENDSVCATIYFNGEIQHIFYFDIYDKTSSDMKAYCIHCDTELKYYTTPEGNIKVQSCPYDK